MEMAKEQLSRRLIASLANVNMRSLHLGQLSKDEWRRVMDAEAQLANWRCFIDDRCGLSVSKMREALRQLRQDEKGLDVLVIDYLQLGDGDGGKKFNRAEEVGAFSRGIMQMAKDYNVCVIALSQCNRSAESRSGGDKGRIGLGDLRESGQVEQDAYQVWGLYRDEIVNPENSLKPGIMEIDILKQRNGPLGRVEVIFQAGRMFIGNLQRED
jgi:replicative DNA helicase